MQPVVPAEEFLTEGRQWFGVSHCLVFLFREVCRFLGVVRCQNRDRGNVHVIKRCDLGVVGRK